MDSLFIIWCEGWKPKAPHDDQLVGFTTREEAEAWLAKTQRMCSDKHTVVQIIKE